MLWDATWISFRARTTILKLVIVSLGGYKGAGVMLEIAIGLHEWMQEDVTPLPSRGREVLLRKYAGIISWTVS
jgi:hypothetical protein